ALNGPSIILGDSELAAHAEPNTARVDGARQHQDEVGAEGLDLLSHPRVSASGDGHRGDDGGHPDDDAGHGKGRAEGVGPEGLEGRPDARPDRHRSRARDGDGKSFSASIGWATRSSATTRPSRNPTTRRANRAMSGSWVTRTTVMPPRL